MHESNCNLANKTRNSHYIVAGSIGVASLVLWCFDYGLGWLIISGKRAMKRWYIIHAYSGNKCCVRLQNESSVALLLM